jgi:hypothetical protein
MTTAEIRSTAFGRVLARFMEAKGIPTEQVEALAERSGVSPGRLLAREVGKTGGHVGYLHGQAGKLGLSEPEKARLAVAYVFGQDAA